MDETTFYIIAKDFLKAVTAELDPYTSKKGIIKVGIGNATLFTPSHIQFAVNGRGPGKSPPLDPILAFVQENGIKFEGTDERGTAFAIMNSIAKNGTKRWNPGAPDALQEAIDNNLSEYFGQVSSEALKIFSETIYEDIWKPTFQKRVKFNV
jgi:hypothetical protein